MWRLKTAQWPLVSLNDGQNVFWYQGYKQDQGGGSLREEVASRSYPSAIANTHHPRKTNPIEQSGG